MHPLIGLHAVFGEIGALAFLWVFVELLSPSESRIRRAGLVAGIGVGMLFLSWILGGYHYLGDYQGLVKPVIKAGPVPWAHSVITETKEHVFIFIPFLAIAAWSIIKAYGIALIGDRKLKLATLLLSGLIVVMAFSMAGMGFIISSGFRSALEAQQATQMP